MKKTLLYESFDINRRLPLNYKDIKKPERFIVPTYTYKPVELITVENAYVSSIGIVYEIKTLLPETVATPGTEWYYIPYLHRQFLKNIKKTPGICLSGTHFLFSNYFHFLIESMPRLFCLKKFADVGHLILPENLPDFSKEYIKMLGFTKIVYLNEIELALAEIAYTILPISDNQSQHPLALREFSKWANYKAKGNNNPPLEPKNLYISRRKAMYRNLSNEEEVIDLLKSFGFETVVLEDYSIAEQILLVQAARNLVAVRGAGLSNIIYMRKGGLVVELSNENSSCSTYFNLASIFEQDIICLQGSPAPGSTQPPFDDFSISIPILKTYLEKYLR